METPSLPLPARSSTRFLFLTPSRALSLLTHQRVVHRLAVAFKSARAAITTSALPPSLLLPPSLHFLLHNHPLPPSLSRSSLTNGMYTG